MAFGDEKPAEVKKEKRKFNLSKNDVSTLLIAVIIIFIAGASIYSFFTPNSSPLQSKDFESFSMSVPIGSDFVKDSSAGITDGSLIYKNKGSYSNEVSVIDINKFSTSIPSNFTLKSEDDNYRIYQSNGWDGNYLVVRNVNKYQFVLMGSNLDTLKDVAISIQVNGDIL
jgi:hypothetical protein